MPGVCGLVGRDPSADLSAALTSMVDRQRHHPWYSDSRYVDEAAGIAVGHIGLGFVNHASQPACTTDGGVVVLMDGEVYDYSEQRRALAAAGRKFRGSSHAELLAHGFAIRGKSFFAELHG